ncbi:MAG: hypothetical protein Q8S11_17305 [Daejeonella sp.]|uniref:hypothetical protein n=1 Tax=Daejeonella sp. TaxID=2805397 RepID=UPI0027337741|nr:hypothetical protein [Daejeonella sp.]MDP3470103.1 hypothetical protein [Daejeonella sp.]
MRLIKLAISSLFILLICESAYSQINLTTGTEITINNFIVKENLYKNNQLAIIAADKDEKPIENLSGTFKFSINGFEQELKFNNGAAVVAQPISKSTFIYVRHENESGNQGKLYYVIKKYDMINPIKISWMVLVLVPALIILLAMMFRKFIIIAGILLLVLFYFNSSNGLEISTFFDTIYDGLKNLFK